MLHKFPEMVNALILVTFLFISTKVPESNLLNCSQSHDKMDQVNFNYSLKNIPIPSQKDYLIKLTNSCEIFVENLRKHINYVLNPNKQKGDKETYGFPSQRKVNAVDELKPLEDELKSLVKTVKFTKTSNQFQNTLSKDKSNIAKDSNVYLNGDKTTNCYRVSKEFSEDLMHRNITKNYKKIHSRKSD